MVQLQIAGCSDLAGVTYYDIRLTGNGHTWSVRRRYNDFVELERRLSQDRSLAERAPLPGKDIFGMFKAWDIGNFRRRRQEGLQQYLSHILRQRTSSRNSAFSQFLEVPFSAERLQSFAGADAEEELLRHITEAMNNVQAHNEQRAAYMAKLRQAEDEERPCFAGIYESKYGTEAPDVFEGSFAEAVALARVEKRLLLVWLYDSNPASDALCSSVLDGEVFRAFLAEYFVFWPGDAQRWLLPKQLKSLFRLTSLPSLLVLKPLSVYDVPEVADPSTGLPVEFPTDTAWALLGAWDATSSGVDEQMVVEFLGSYGERAAEEKRLLEEEHRFQREYADEAALLRQEQDREVEESERKDHERAQEAELQRKATEAEQMRTEAEAADKAALEAEAMAKKEALRQARRMAAAQYCETSDGEPGRTCKLVLRLPNGQRVERSFDAEEQLAAVYAWADCCGEVSELQGGCHLEVPHNFYLATTYPRVALREQTRTLRDLQLFPNAILALSPEDA